MNLKYTFINPNSVDCTAEVLLKTFVEANLSKVHDVIKTTIDTNKATEKIAV